MNIYLYPDNLVSLLTLINHLINLKIKPDDIKPLNYSPNLLSNIINLNLAPNYELLKKLDPSLLKTITLIYLSNADAKELVIYYFYLNYLKYHNRVYSMRNLKCVTQALKICKYVSQENHKLKGFVRFQELPNHVLYAEIEPTNNVISLLSQHFQNRLSGEYWIINDLKRNIISVYNKKNYYLFKDSKFKVTTSKTDYYQELWTTFYQTIGIKERENPRCRENFMPKKYWNHIIEMRNEYEKSHK